MFTKKIVVGSTCALMILGLGSYAQDEHSEPEPQAAGETLHGSIPEDRDGRRGHRPPPIARIIEDFDANGDGKLQVSEAPEQFPEEVFKRLDMNDDGAIDLDEAERIHEMKRPDPRGQGRSDEARRGPRNDHRGSGGDDQLLREDRPPRDRRYRGDRDAHGNRGERPGSQQGNFSQVIDKFDLNGDGELQIDEAPDRMLRMFAQLDRNRDGSVDAREANASIDRRRGPKDRNQRRDGSRPNQGDRGFHAERGERPEPGERFERSDRPQRGERPERGDRPPRRPREGRREMSQVIKYLDGNDDGMLQESEVPEPMLELFRRMDQNADQVVDPEEANRFKGPRRPRREAPDQSGNPPVQ